MCLFPSRNVEHNVVYLAISIILIHTQIIQNASIHFHRFCKLTLGFSKIALGASDRKASRVQTFRVVIKFSMALAKPTSNNSINATIIYICDIDYFLEISTIFSYITMAKLIEQIAYFAF